MGQPEASDPAFTDAECDAVRDWIKDGGTLLFITDHAPMGSAAECLAKRFNVSMSKGAASDPSNSEGGDSWLVFSRQNHLLGDHPIIRGARRLRAGRPDPDLHRHVAQGSGGERPYPQTGRHRRR